MGFTDPFNGVIVPRKMTDAELANAIRLDIISEIDATSLYHSHIQATDNPQAIAILTHIMNEEKEHIAEFLEMLKILDPTQAEELAAAPAEFAEIQAGVADEDDSSGGPSDDAHPKEGPSLTVGDLFLKQG